MFHPFLVIQLFPFPDSSHITPSTISAPPSACSGSRLYLEFGLACDHHPLSGFYSRFFPVFSASLLLSSHFLFTCSTRSCSFRNKNKQKIHCRPHYFLHISSSLPYPSFTIPIPCLSWGPLSAIQATGYRTWLHSNHRGLCPDPSDTVH